MIDINLPSSFNIDLIGNFMHMTMKIRVDKKTRTILNVHSKFDNVFDAQLFSKKNVGRKACVFLKLSNLMSPRGIM